MALTQPVITIEERGFLSNLDPRYVRKLEGMALEAFFDPDHVIFHEGDPTSYFYILKSGSVVLEIPRPDGMVEMQTLHAGDALGWSSLLDPPCKHLQARALTSVSAAAFDGVELRKLCEQEPRFGYAIFKRLVEVLAGRVDASRLQIAKAPASRRKPLA